MGTNNEKCRVLIAEDNYSDLFLFQQAMKTSGLINLVEPHVAYDGAQVMDMMARAAHENKLYSLILLDLNMPRLSGKDALARMRQNKMYDDVFILMFSTSDDPREIQECLDLKANAYIQKPLLYDQLKIFCSALGKCITNCGTISPGCITHAYSATQSKLAL